MVSVDSTVCGARWAPHHHQRGTLPASARSTCNSSVGRRGLLNRQLRQPQGLVRPPSSPLDTALGTSVVWAPSLHTRAGKLSFSEGDRQGGVWHGVHCEAKGRRGSAHRAAANRSLALPSSTAQAAQRHVQSCLSPRSVVCPLCPQASGERFVLKVRGHALHRHTCTARGIHWHPQETEAAAAATAAGVDSEAATAKGLDPLNGSLGS